MKRSRMRRRRDADERSTDERVGIAVAEMPAAKRWCDVGDGWRELAGWEPPRGCAVRRPCPSKLRER